MQYFEIYINIDRAFPGLGELKMVRHLKRYQGFSQYIVIRKGLYNPKTISSVNPRREGDVPKKGKTCGSAGHKDEGRLIKSLFLNRSSG
jgi:hypothetical protein